MTICANVSTATAVTAGPSRLSRVAAAAAHIARSRGAVVAVVRGIDRTSSSQSTALRSKIERRGVRTFELTSTDVIDSAHRAAAGAAAVIDLTTPPTSDAHRLAAYLQVPLLTLANSTTAPTTVSTLIEQDICDAIGLFAHRYAFALDRVTVTPCGPDPTAMEVLVGGHEPLRLHAAEVSAKLRETFLEIRITKPGGAVQHVRGPRCALRPLTGRFVVICDGIPTANLRGLLSITVWPRRVTVLTFAEKATTR